MGYRNIPVKHSFFKKGGPVSLLAMGILFFIIGAPPVALAWFHHSTGAGQLPLNTKEAGDYVSDHYIFFQNQTLAGQTLLSGKHPGAGTMANAGEIKIDVPFNLLSKTMVNPQALLDRQIAANLKVKNILEQYLAMKKKNALLLKDLSIPYLDGPEKTENAPDSGPDDIEPAVEMKRKMADIILFQGSGQHRLPIQETQDFQTAWAGTKKDGKGEASYGETGESSPGYASGNGQSRHYQTSYGRETELPWIFALGLKLFRYIIHNKIEIFAWAAVMAMAGLISVLVIKR